MNLLNQLRNHRTLDYYHHDLKDNRTKKKEILIWPKNIDDSLFQ